jgi:tRNA dimethylallyltransferase
MEARHGENPWPGHAHAFILAASPIRHQRLIVFMSPKPPLVVVAGPTGVGKTSLSLSLAGEFDAEIVNADSRAFYRGMDIGTAKPSPEERLAVPHHLIDILDPADEMSLAHFQQLAFEAINDILWRGKLPMLVGGTAQYLNAVVENWRVPQVAPDQAFRRELEQRVESEGVAGILEELRTVDPASAERTGPNPRRIIRALEVYRNTGTPMSQLVGKNEPHYQALQFELWLPREILHQRISQRVEDQIRRGLIDEVRALLDSGVDPGVPAFSSIGYREVVSHIRGEVSLEETAAAIRHATNRLVRHQQTWFRKNPEMTRIDLTDPNAETVIRDLIRQHFAHK